MTSDRDLGLSDGHLAAIKLRLLDLPHSVWRCRDRRVERASHRGDGQLVAEFESGAVAEFCAAAPHDVDILVREVEVLRDQVAQLREQAVAADRSALAARAEAGQWRERATVMKRAWRDLHDVMEGKR